MKYIERIASADQSKRKQAIKDILGELGVKYTLQDVHIGEHDVTNIVVSLNPSPERLVIGAHHDSVENSTGSNDDASGCSVLLHLIERLKDTKRSIDFVFFDREEVRDHGSDAYMDTVGQENIAAMINLDMCGWGDTVTVSDKGNLGNPAFGGVLDEKVIEKHGVNVVGFLPNGDDNRFAARDIPNISVCTLYGKDAAFFRHLGEKIKSGEPLSDEDREGFRALEVVTTMHLGPNDNIGSCHQLAVDKVTEWIADGLAE